MQTPITCGKEREGLRAVVKPDLLRKLEEVGNSLKAFK
jgi:hypothetical protein